MDGSLQSVQSVAWGSANYQSEDLSIATSNSTLVAGDASTRGEWSEVFPSPSIALAASPPGGLSRVNLGLEDGHGLDDVRWNDLDLSTPRAASLASTPDDTERRARRESPDAYPCTPGAIADMLFNASGYNGGGSYQKQPPGICYTALRRA